MTPQLTLELPEKVSTNVFYRKHAMKRYPLEQAFYLAVREAVRRTSMPPVTSYPLPLVEYLFEIPGKPLDNLNLSSMAKMVEDGLRHAGVLKDDTPAEVAGVLLRQVRSSNKRIRVTVWWAPQESAGRSVRKRPASRRAPVLG